MESPTKTLFLAKLLLVFNAIYIPALGECPPAEDITPCECSREKVDKLTCSHIKNIEDIDNAFRQRNSYYEVNIFLSVLPHIPYQIFESSRIRRLNIYNSTLIYLFDKPPKSDRLRSLYIKDSLIRYPTMNLTNLTNLDTLSINSTRLGDLTSTFSSSLPSSLTEITLYRTETRTIEHGAFSKLVNLYQIDIQSNPWSSFSRDVFPTPFEVTFMYLDDNQLTSLPRNAFNSMPSLRFIHLRGNQLKEIPIEAFQYYPKLLYLEGNPLSCDCKLRWLVVGQIWTFTSGTCETPRNLKGKSIMKLQIEDIPCP